MKSTSLTVADLKLELHGDLNGFVPTLVGRKVKAGVHEVTLRLKKSGAKALPPAVELKWRQPYTDIHAGWWTDRHRGSFLIPEWMRATHLIAKATSCAPVICLHSQSGRNRLTFAAQDALHPVDLYTGVNEETGSAFCGMKLIPGGYARLKELTAVLRFDFRDHPYHRALREVSQWWAAQPGYTPAPVPDVGRLPMYSTWYSFHQVLEPAAVEHQCRLAKALGCDAVIEDDGWQTLDSQRGYAFTGDWKPERIPDMAGHVQRVHAAGLKMILWYAVPFIGRKSKAWARFKGKFLNYSPEQQWSVVDPRFPEVREYLIQTYERAVKEWDLDGFKLDFVDSFNAGPNDPTEAVGGRDYGAVDEAVDRLLADVMTRLSKLKPGMLIEFRQSYVGPLMRKYGNLFRAADCPNDCIGNRVRILDVRLLCGNTAAHADMIMWHPDEPVESAGLQMVNILFGVPQISVLLDKIPAAQQAMLKFWLGFWRDHRDCLLDGDLEPLHPELNFPVVRASTRSTRVVAVYGETAVAPLGAALPKRVQVVNGTREGRVVMELSAPTGARKLTVRDCQGRVVRQTKVNWPAGAQVVAVPPAGLATLQG